MLQRKLNEPGKHTPFVNAANKIYLYAGLFILISSLICMIVTIARADSVVMWWFPLMLLGIALVFVSELKK